MRDFSLLAASTAGARTGTNAAPIRIPVDFTIACRMCLDRFALVSDITVIKHVN